MAEKLTLMEKNYRELSLEITKGVYPKNSIFNFINSNGLYLFKNHKIFREHVLKKNNFNFIDGFILSLYFSIVNLRSVKRLKGPDFSDTFLKDEFLINDKKQLFIGLSKEDLKKVMEKYPLLKKENCFAYDLPFLKNEKFDDSELINFIKRIRPNYVWVAIGNPKQEILSNDLSESVEADFFFNVGAFFDYAKNKKKQSPRFFQNFGIEWLYRLVTDFKLTWKKVKRSFIANGYLFNYVKLRD